MLALVMGSSSLIVLTLVTTVIAYFYIYLRSAFTYWKDHGIPSVKATVVFKNMKDLLLGRISFYEMQTAFYNSLSGHRYGGYYDFTRPSLMIRDPELIEHVLIKDFNCFMDRAAPSSSEDDILSLNMANAEGKRWSDLRHKLTPTFTSGKLKGMFEQMDRCSEDLVRYIVNENSVGDNQLDGKLLMNRYAMEVIAKCGFGIEFTQDKERDKFLMMVKTLSSPSFSQMLRIFVKLYCPGIFDLLRVKMMSPEASNYFTSLVKEALQYRAENEATRNDFLQLLLELNKNEKKEEDQKSMEKNDTFSFESAIAQAVLFLTAGVEAAASVMNFFLFAVAKHPDIQRKLQQEVDQVLCKHGQWNHQMLKDMTYIDQVIQETMRMYPGSSVLMRKCTKPYQLPDSDFVIKPGTRVIIPLFPLHYDPQYYPEPEKFDPNRFVDTNYKSSGRYLPFGDGPRICIDVLEPSTIAIAFFIKRCDDLFNSFNGPIYNNTKPKALNEPLCKKSSYMAFCQEGVCRFVGLFRAGHVTFRPPSQLAN